MGVAPDAQALKAVPDATATVRRLLVAYAHTLEIVDGLPLAPMVATGWYWRSRPSAPIRLPRVSWMLRSLMLWHIDRVLLGAEQAFRRRSALGIAGAGEADALDAVTEFRASLPSRSKALRLGVLAAATLVVGTLLLHINVSPVSGAIPAAAAINQLLSTLGALQLTTSSASSAVDALFKATPAVLAGAALLLSVSLYLILLPVASAFRLKRLLLNLYPRADTLRSNTPASWSVSRSTGVYSLEHETFAMFGSRVPREPPFDLLVSLTLPSYWIAFCVYIFLNLDLAPWSLSLALSAVVEVLLFFIPPAAARLSWLAAAWRARNGRPRSTWLLADEVIVPWRTQPVKCRSAVLIGWLSLMFIFLAPIAGWLWWSTSHDLRDLGRAYDVKDLARTHPVAQGLAVGTGSLLYFVLTLIVLCRAPRFIREAQAAIGLERQVGRYIAWLAPLWPVLCLVLQRELNRLWQAQGIPIDQRSEPGDLARTLDARVGDG